MTPENLALLKGVVEIIRALGTWPNWGVVLLLASLVMLAPLGSVIYIWRKDIGVLRIIQESHRKDMADQMRHYREDTSNILGRLGEYMKEMRRMYESNVELVQAREKDYSTLCKIIEDQQGLTVKMVTTLTALEASIKANQFCPAARVEKKTVEVPA